MSRRKLPCVVEPMRRHGPDGVPGFSGETSMYTALGRLNRAEILIVEAPAFIGALLVAEGLYKFHSFTLESAAFLLTWMAFGGLLAAGRKAIAGRSAPTD